MRLTLIDLAARPRHQARIAEVGLKGTVLGTKGARTAHPGQGDDVAVIRDAEAKRFYVTFLSVNLLSRDLPCPSGPPKLQKKILGATEFGKLFGKASPDDQKPVSLEPVKKGAELGLDRLAENAARQIYINDDAH